MLKILPQLFYQTDAYKKILVDGLCCVIHKIVREPVLHKEGYVSAHAITLVLKGMLRVENNDGIVTHVQRNQMIFLPKGLYTISDIIPDGDVFEAIVFFFDEELIGEFIRSNRIESKNEKCVSYKIMEYSPLMRLYTESLLQLYSEKAVFTKKLARIKLTELLHLLSFAESGSCFMDVLSTLHNRERRGLREFMESNFSKPLAIEDYAYLTGRSLSSFRRDFIAQFGVSPKQWLIERRLDRASQLLATFNWNVTQVALEAGYENTSHFIKAFHKKFGTSPKQFLINRRKEVLV